MPGHEGDNVGAANAKRSNGCLIQGFRITRKMQKQVGGAKRIKTPPHKAQKKEPQSQYKK